MIPTLIAGFTLGFTGSLHCVGMCGPLSLALPTHFLSPVVKFISIVMYQLGRVITYSMMGMIFALAGRSVYIAGFQQWFSISLGIFILLLASLYYIQGQFQFGLFNSFYDRIMKLINAIIKRHPGLSGFLFLGMANGLLPCGMVYVALASTLSFYKVYQGTCFMAAFGLGTLPFMMLVGYGSRIITPARRKYFKQAIPMVVTATGILLILRGLNLGITFISPLLSHPNGSTIICHP